jgi:CheY-like chemotaxis protein
MEQISAVRAFERYSPSVTNKEYTAGLRSVRPAKKQILIIDDSPTVCAVAELALRREGYSTRSFPDGIAAMKWLLKSESWYPDLAIVDIGLPKMDGYEVIRHLKANPRLGNIVCITLSARDGTVDQLKGKLVGAQMCLIKPCTVQMLCRAAHACLLGDNSVRPE